MRNDRGFIALLSVIIIGTMLLVTIIGGSLIGFFTRFNQLDFELKERSSAAADACVQKALLSLATSPTYSGNSRYTLNSLDSCYVGPVSAGTFEVQATSSTAVTNLLVTVNASSFSIKSEREIPNF